MIFKSEIEKYKNYDQPLNLPNASQIFKKIKEEGSEQVKERFKKLRNEFELRKYSRETAHLKEEERKTKRYNILPSPGKAMMYIWPFAVKLKGMICFLKTINSKLERKYNEEQKKSTEMKNLKIKTKKDCENKTMKELIVNPSKPNEAQKDLERIEVLTDLLNIVKIDEGLYNGIYLTFSDIINNCQRLKNKLKEIKSETYFPHEISKVNDDKLFSVYKRITENYLEKELNYLEFKGDKKPDSNYINFYNRYIDKKQGIIE